MPSSPAKSGTTKTYRTLSIGGATYDLFVRVPHDVVHGDESSPSFSLPLGAKIRVEDVIETCGGGASNTAVGLRRLGCDAAVSCVIGDDQWGRKLLENFRNEGVREHALTIVEGEISSFSIILSASGGERVILYEPGTNAHLHDVTFDRETAAAMDWVILNHVQESAEVIRDDLVGMLANPLPRLTWNPGGSQIRTGMREAQNRALLAHTNLLLLNREEALAFSGRPSAEESIRALLDCGAACVCVTDGKRGAVASDGKRLYRCGVPSDGRVVDTTGAGDAFCTGATWALLRGSDLPTALRTGTINGASVIGSFGAQAGLLREIDMHTRMSSMEIPVSDETL